MSASKETYTSIYTSTTSTTNSSAYGSDMQHDTKVNLTNNSGVGNTTSGYSSYYGGGGGGTSSTLRESEHHINNNNNNQNSGYTFSGQSELSSFKNDNSILTDNHNNNNSSSAPTNTEPVSLNINLNSASFVQDEKLAHEVLEKAGPATTYQRKEFMHDIASLADKEPYQESELKCSENISSSATINQDPNPIRILKPSNQNVVYKQQVNIRYLQPPTPPPQAPIIIREKQLPPPPPQPPIIIRQTAPAIATPPPLIIRERAPSPPPVLEPTIIERPIPAAPVPPRQVIIERIPAPPTKPRPIIYEKWLPYKQTRRPVIIQKFKPIIVQNTPKNIIIEYEKPKAVAVRQVIEEGVFRADPNTYHSLSTANAELRIVDRITDLPIENSRILSQFNKNTNNNNEDYTDFENIKLENIDQYLNTHLNIQSTTSTHFSTSSLTKNLNKSLPNLADNNYYEASTNGYQTYTTSTTYPASAEYETITTTVPQSLAEKIIAEAQAAGAAISRSSSVIRHSGNF